eukprot:4105559-Karenia_brevis.AAC.1
MESQAKQQMQKLGERTTEIEKLVDKMALSRGQVVQDSIDIRAGDFVHADVFENKMRDLGDAD